MRFGPFVIRVARQLLPYAPPEPGFSPSLLSGRLHEESRRKQSPRWLKSNGSSNALSRFQGELILPWKGTQAHQPLPRS
jgi:hypothetical protein